MADTEERHERQENEKEKRKRKQQNKKIDKWINQLEERYDTKIICLFGEVNDYM